MRLLNFSLAVCTIVAILFSGAHASAKNPFKGLLSSSKESKEPKKPDNLPDNIALRHIYIAFFSKTDTVGGLR